MEEFRLNIIKKDGIVYYPCKYKDEEELEQLVFENVNNMFDVNSILLEKKKKIMTALGIGSVPDGFVLSIEKGSWYILENELSTHDIYGHILAQIGKFEAAMKTNRSNTVSNLAEVFYEEVVNSSRKRKVFEKAAPGQEIFKVISDILKREYKIIVVIDDTDKLQEAQFSERTRVLSFKTYCKNRHNQTSDCVYLFDTVFDLENGRTGSKTVVSPPKIAAGGKAHLVTLKELVEYHLLVENQILYFYDGEETVESEKAAIDSSTNRLKYLKNGQHYSKSKLAMDLLVKYRSWSGDHYVQGPDYWKTEDGILLFDLEEKVRKIRGDRK